jgi:hypothetical protein
MELDPVNFSDESFASIVSIKPRNADEDGGSPNKRKMKNTEIMTDELYYRDADTNTKYKKEEVSVSHYIAKNNH